MEIVKLENVAEYIKENFLNKPSKGWIGHIPEMIETEHAIVLQSDGCNCPSYFAWVFLKGKDEGFKINLEYKFSSMDGIPSGKFEVNVVKFTNATYAFYDLTWPFWKDGQFSEVDFDEFKDEVDENSTETDDSSILPEEFNTREKLLGFACKFYDAGNWINYGSDDE